MEFPRFRTGLGATKGLMLALETSLLERFSKRDATSTRTSFNREGSESRTPARRKQIMI